MQHPRLQASFQYILGRNFNELNLSASISNIPVLTQSTTVAEYAYSFTSVYSLIICIFIICRFSENSPFPQHIRNKSLETRISKV